MAGGDNVDHFSSFDSCSLTRQSVHISSVVSLGSEIMVFDLRRVIHPSFALLLLALSSLSSTHPCTIHRSFALLLYALGSLPSTRPSIMHHPSILRSSSLGSLLLAVEPSVHHPSLFFSSILALGCPHPTSIFLALGQLCVKVSNLLSV
jgi:hypothetical protein